MKLQTVNVIEIQHNCVKSVQTFMFDNSDEKSKTEMVNKAEVLFELKARELGYDEDDHIDFDHFIEEGYFSNSFGNSVNLVWSDVDWV